jgi:hypothetical protein
MPQRTKSLIKFQIWTLSMSCPKAILQLVKIVWFFFKKGTASLLSHSSAAAHSATRANWA